MEYFVTVVILTQVRGWLKYDQQVIAHYQYTSK